MTRVDNWKSILGLYLLIFDCEKLFPRLEGKESMSKQVSIHKRTTSLTVRAQSPGREVTVRAHHCPITPSRLHSRTAVALASLDRWHCGGFTGLRFDLVLDKR